MLISFFCPRVHKEYQVDKIIRVRKKKKQETLCLEEIREIWVRVIANEECLGSLTTWLFFWKAKRNGRHRGWISFFSEARCGAVRVFRKKNY